MNRILSLILVFLVHHAALAEEPRVAILGDSITYSGRWSTLVESALRSTPAFSDAEIVNFGLASETLSGFRNRDMLGEDSRALICTSGWGVFLIPSNRPTFSPVMA